MITLLLKSKGGKCDQIVLQEYINLLSIGFSSNSQDLISHLGIITSQNYYSSYKQNNHTLKMFKRSFLFLT